MAKRDPLDGRLVVLLGGSGFLGTHVAQDLLARGARLRVASRDPMAAWKLKPLANLGQLQFVRCDVTRRDSLELALRGADYAVFLAGAFAGDLEALMERAPGEAAAIMAQGDTADEGAARSGARGFVLVSAIGADADSEVAYARTKARGEANVLREFVQASVIRPSILFGADDAFLSMFARLIRLLPALPVFGPDARLQPLHVADAAAAIVAALADPAAHGGRTFEIGGPDVLTMGEINRMIAEAQGRKRAFIDLPDAVSRTFARATGWLPGAPMTTDQWKLLKRGSVADPALPGLAELGVTPRPLALFLERYMTPYRTHGRFTDRTEFHEDYESPREVGR